MKQTSHKYLLYPILILVLVLVFDKLAFLPAYKEAVVYWKKIEPAIYESRQDLFSQLENRHYQKRAYKDKKLGIILGSSRSSGFDSEVIARYIPNSYTYNFSAPFASPAYYYYWFYRLLASNIRPDFIIVELDAGLFGQRAIQYQLSYSFDLDFVWRHTDLNRPRLRNPWRHEGRGFSFSDAESYYAHQFIGFYKYPFKPSNISANFEETFVPLPGGGLKNIRTGDFRKYAQPLIQQVNERKLGGIPNFFFVQIPPEKLIEDAKLTAARDLRSFKPDPTQIIFTKNLLRQAARQDIPILIYMPVVSDPFYEQMQEFNIDRRFNQPFFHLVENVQKQFPPALLQIRDMNREKRLECRQFQDSYHLSGPCFPQLTGLLLENFARQVK